MHRIAGKDTEVHEGRDLEAEGQRHHGEVEGAHIVDLFQGVGVIRPHVRLVGLLGGLVEVVVLLYQLVQLGDDQRLHGYTGCCCQNFL